ncbi:MAG: carboxymuconolactone decarboxylase family protein [Chloroflexota bacterium]|nr:carboxymuconolactone decarboxylase family protein [Chloroflexota bacterium]
MSALDAPTRELVRLSVAVAVGSEHDVRGAMAHANAEALDPTWVEELILQTYLFCGFPRALNAAREWRRVSERLAPVTDEGTANANVGHWAERGERTCAMVYGDMYSRLRLNIRDLHPALDAWMIVDGYGKVLSRPGLDLKRRELCIVAVCAALGQERQLHAHLHGALHAGASKPEVAAVLELAVNALDSEQRIRVRRLWARVERKL